MKGAAVVGLVVALAAAAVEGFYLPGVAPVDYTMDQPVDLKVNKLTSTTSQVPYEYYSLRFCRPKKIVSQVENLGEVLRGDRIENSPYVVSMRTNEACKVLCRSELTQAMVNHFAARVADGYRVNFIVDNLPAAMSYEVKDEDGETVKMYQLGFALGDADTEMAPAVATAAEKAKVNAKEKGFLGVKTKVSTKKTYTINNHVTLTLLYHPVEGAEFPSARIVGFEVLPRSIRHPDGSVPTCAAGLPPHILDVRAADKDAKDATVDTIIFTYDVQWKESDILWASRWDTYLYMPDDSVHWFGIFNSLVIVLFLTALIALITVRALRQDLSRYNALVDSEEIQEEFGWKLVHGDVFRPPRFPIWLSVSVGSGVQVLGMAVVTLVFAVLGFLSPANRGGLLSMVVTLFVLMGIWAGYTASRLYKMMAGTSWKLLTFMTAMFYPAVIFGIFFTVNFFLWGEKSAGAVPFTTLVALLVLWFGVSVPLVVMGAYFGFKKKAIEHPVRTNQIPRQIPDQPWYMSSSFVVLSAGLIPFGAIFIELYFIMSSMWQNSFYYIFGILFIVFVMLIITCGEIAIVVVYIVLCQEDYHWWWRSFLCPASSAVYVFAYCWFYFHSELDISDFTPTLLYFSYSFILSLLLFVMTGAVGFYACLFFVSKIYGSVKVD